MSTTSKGLGQRFWIILLLTAGLNVWNIVYLPSYFYVPFQTAFGLTNQQQGFLLSMYGVMALVGYFFGGMVADKFSAKGLMVSSSILTAALGLYISTNPGYTMMLVVYFLFGITATLLYWSAFVKSLRLMGNNSEQGTIFGLFESFYGLVSLVLSFVVLGALSSYIEQGGSFAYVIYCYSGFSILIGILIFFFYNPEKYLVYKSETNSDQDKFDFKMVPAALKLPITWINTIIVFCMFVIISGALYINPFVNEVYLVPVTWATALGIVIKYGFRIFCSPLGGKMVDKAGKSPMVLVKTSILIIIASVLLLFIPKTPNLMVGGLIAAFFFCVAFNLGRACMYVPVAEAKVPTEMYGTVVGIVSAIGYSSDIYIWTIFGSILDNAEGVSGYNSIFMIYIGAAIVLVLTGLYYDKYLKKLEAAEAK